jgi:uncharacterized protein (DUF1501 family)
MAKTRRRRAARRQSVPLDGFDRSSTFRSTIAGAEAVGTGAMNVVMGTMASAIRGFRDVGGEVGSTAVLTVRGSLRAAEVIGGDVARLATDAATGALDAADRIGAAAARAVRGIVAEAAGQVRASARKPPQKAKERRANNSRSRNEAVA